MATDSVRDIIMRSVKGNPAARDDVRDWPREANELSFCNTQIRNWVREELVNRWRNFGLSYTNTGQATNYDSLESPRALFAMQEPASIPDWDKDLYKGPKTSWVRIASNAENVGDDGRTMKGFIMMGNGNFHDTYGFDKGDGYNGGGGDAETLLGYDQSTPQQEHRIQEPDYKHRPTPGVTSIETEDHMNSGTTSCFRRTTVKFTCWSPTQLDYLQNYFFQPAMSMSIEWGWNTFPRDSLLPLDEKGIKKRVDISNNARVDSDKYEPGAAAKHIRNGQGNYGFCLGLITSYDYSIREDGGYDCSVELQCIAEMAGNIPDRTTKKIKVLSDGRYETFHDYITWHLDHLLRPRYSRMSDSQLTQTRDQAPRNVDTGPERTDSELLQEAQEMAAKRDDSARVGSLRPTRGPVQGEPIDPTKDTYGNPLPEGQGPDYDPSDVHTQDEQAIRLTRGRYFIFEPFASSKPYYRGKDNAGGSYITVGLLIDLMNVFFAKVTSTNATICEFSCWNSRAVAHPNLKSINGDVLLIPNSIAPRWNTNTFAGDPGDFGSTVGNEKDSSTRSEAYKLLLKGAAGDDRYSASTATFLNMINKTMRLDSPVSSLQEAMVKSPRDDLHRILSVNAQPGYNLQHPAIAGRIHGDRRDKLISGSWSPGKTQNAYESAEDTIRPFPDFKTFETTDSSDGYSGRIADLFVNIKVIKEAMGGAQKGSPKPAREILMEVMNQVSGAAGNIWDFQLVGGDSNTTSNTVLQLIDANFGGTEPVGSLKKKAWVFPVHRGDSVVRSMDLSVEISNEIASSVLFANYEEADSETSFYRPTSKDMLVDSFGSDDYNKPKEGTEALLSRKTYDTMGDEGKYIVAMNSSSLNTNSLSATGTTKYKTLDDIDVEAFTQDDPRGLAPALATHRIWDFYIDLGPGAVGEEGSQYYIYAANGSADRDKKIRNALQGITVPLGIHDDHYKFAEGSEPATRPFNYGDIYLHPDSPAHSMNSGKKHGFRQWGGSDPSLRGARRYYTIYGDHEWITQSNNLTKGMSAVALDNPLADSSVITKDLILEGEAPKGWSRRDADELLKQLIGMDFVWNSGVIDHGDVAWDDEIPFGPYTIKNVCIPRDSDGKPTVTKTKGRVGGNNYQHPIVMVIQSKTRQLLDQNQRDRLYRAKQNNQEIPSDIKIFMKQRGISPADQYLEQEYKVISSDINAHNVQIKNKHEISSNYGVDDFDDYEIDIEMVDPFKDRMLDFCRVDTSEKNNMANNNPVPGADLTITLDGIEGFRNNDVFNCSGVPIRFYNQGLWRITNVKHSINDGDWQTTLESKFVFGQDFTQENYKKKGQEYISGKKDLTIDTKPSRTLL